MSGLVRCLTLILEMINSGGIGFPVYPTHMVSGSVCRMWAIATGKTRSPPQRHYLKQRLREISG